LKAILVIIAIFISSFSFGQVTFVVDELPEGHDYSKSMYISGDFENWSGGSDEFKLTQNDKQYSITLPSEYCNLLFKFTLGSWSSVELNSDEAALDNRAYNCSGSRETVNISIKNWTTAGGVKKLKSTARKNVQVFEEEFEMPQLNRKRKIWVYLPPDYDKTKEHYPVLYMHDGQNLFDNVTSFAGEWNVDETLDRLYNDLGFKLIVVGIDNGGKYRLNEYSPWDNPEYDKGDGAAYADFIVNTLKPHVDKTFRTRSDASNTAMMGSSMGGLISHYIGLNYSDVFGKVGVFSPAFWYAPQSFDLAKSQNLSKHQKMYLLAGGQEGGNVQFEQINQTVKDMNRMVELLKENDFPTENIDSKVVPFGKHNEKLWRESFEESIVWLFDLKKQVLGNPERIFESINQTSSGIEINVNDGKYVVQYYTNDIVETSFIPKGENFKDESHAVILNPSNIDLTIDTKESSHFINSQGIDVTIHHQPFQISYSYNGKPVTSEKKGYHNTDYGEAIQMNVSQKEVLYGAGSRALGMNRRGNRLQLYNKAHYGYEDRSPLMNYTMPIVISSNKYMIHFDNAPIGYLDLDSKMDNTITYETISGRKTYQVIVGETWEDLIDNYTDLTGKQPLPPRWVFGNFASRFGYHSQKEVEQTITKFKEDKIPVDAVILDVFWFGKDIQGHMGNLEFLKDSFPEPKKMIKNFKDQGVKTTLITEPFILSTSKRWDEAVKENILAKDSLENPYTFDFYFGNSGIIDIYNKKAENWFWNIYKEIDKMGVDGVWGDLGEPEMHPSDIFHATGTADEVHNIYGHDWARLVYEGYAKDIPNKRPFILMRAGYSGSQRYGMIPWSGDVNRTWGGLHPQVEIALQMGMQGLGYMHSDLGGFGGDNLDDQLYTRWLQYGVFQPIFRPHAQEVVPSEPVYREEKTKQVAKESINLRYRMLPYTYQTAFENSQTGISFMRPLFYEDDNPELFDNSSEFLWGNDILVSPIIDPNIKEQEVYFPKNNVWFDFYSDDKVQGGQSVSVRTKENSIPTFVRAGAFIPMTKLVQTTDDYSFNNFDLHYYYDESVLVSEREFYNDDGLTNGAYDKGQYEILEFEFKKEKRGLEFEFDAEIGENYQSEEKQIKLIVHSLKKLPKRIKINGKRRMFYLENEGKNVVIPITWDTSEELDITMKLKK